jgi:chromosome segregation ATPase
MAKRSSGGLSGASVTDLRKELARRGRRVGTLERKRDRLLDKVRKLNDQINEFGGATRGLIAAASGRTRPRNEANLVESLQKVLTDKVMSVTDVAEAVQKAGYATTSPNFRTIVNQALIASGKFKRVDRGQYTAK